MHKIKAMRKLNHLIFTFLLFSCSQSGVLNKVFSFPSTLKEVSGIEVINKSKLIWVLQDSGNEAAIYGLDKGKYCADDCH
jgi:hypothetical protein